MAKQPHRYGCRCPSCNEGITRVDAKGKPVKIPIPNSSGTEIRTPEDAGMPAQEPTAAPKKK